jgi:hypothetical protein
VPADEIAFCLFEASSIETATEVNQRAAIPFERILEIVRLGPKCRMSPTQAIPIERSTS